MHHTPLSLVVVTKQEARDGPKMQAPRTTHETAFAQDTFLSPFVDLVDDDIMDDTTVWSDHRPRDNDRDSLDSLLCDEDAPTLNDSMMSPVATSDMVGVQQLPPRDHSTLGKSVSLRRVVVPLDETMEPSALTAADLKNSCTSHGCKQRSVNGSGRCMRHTGGQLCKAPGCTKNTQSRGLCIRHGGGRRCEVEGCPRGAQAHGKCKTHGGGVRCKAPDCWRSSQGSGLCRTHGGGKLCDYPGCTKGTQRHGKCSTHGGVRRCQANGCEKVDRGGGLCARHKGKAKASIDDSGSSSFVEDTNATEPSAVD